MPLGFVVCVTMLKQGYEDWLRHKMDEEVNNKPATVIRHGKIQVRHRQRYSRSISGILFNYGILDDIC